MKNGKFTAQERATLAALPAVREVRSTQIIYSPAFIHHAMNQYHQGIRPSQIFADAGLPASMIGYKRIERAIARWKEAELKDLLGVTPAPHIRHRNQVDTIKASKRQAVERQRSMRERDKEKYLARIAELEAQVEVLKAEGALVKKRLRAEKTLTKNDRFALINKIATKNPKARIAPMCEALEVSRSGYYKWVSSAPMRARRKARDEQTRDLIEQAFTAHGVLKGSRLIRDTLKREHHITMNRKKIQRIMRTYGILFPCHKKRPYYPIGTDGLPKIAPNLVEQDFRQGSPRAVLSTDITYLRYEHGFAYLSAVIDTQTNEILAHQLSQSLEMPFVEQTLDQLKDLNLDKNTIIHSDQGSHYTSVKYRKKIRDLGITQSMSRKACCWDNAPIESFFGRLKEQTPPTSTYTYQELEQTINNYIHYYNYHRGQQRLGWLTPTEYSHQLAA